MSENDWLDKEPLRQLLHELTDGIVARYRISWPHAEQMVHESVVSNLTLREAAKETSPEKLKRTRVFKQAASDAKRKIYYHLRTYRGDAERLAERIDHLKQLPSDAPLSTRNQAVDQILQNHISTRERLPRRHEFYQTLFANVLPPTHILDVGCGVHPLMFPFHQPWGSKTVQYLAIDTNPLDIACVEAFAKLQRNSEKIIAFRWDLAEGWERVLKHALCEEFDLALMMKLVPVLKRQHRELLTILSQTPATEWLVTGSRVSLTKHISIERREKRVLEEFVRQAGRVVKHEFTVGEEFAWLITKSE